MATLEMSWKTFFGSVPDFHKNRRKKHQLVAIVDIALCTVISGADDFAEIEMYGRKKEPFLRTFLWLPNGIPSHDMFNRVFKLMAPKAFGACLCDWSKQILELLASELNQINIDGKVLRGTAKAGFKKSGSCLVSAWV